jgi:hypothetical protein
MLVDVILRASSALSEYVEYFEDLITNVHSRSLCQLNNKIPKTVFDDRAGNFTQSDVKQMCTTAITLNIQENGAVKDGAFVVQTKFGKPIYVQHQVAGQGSCFPLGIHATTSKLSSPCKTSGEKAIAGKTTEIAAR